MSGTGKHGREKNHWKDIEHVMACISYGMAILADLSSLCVPFFRKKPVLICVEIILIIIFVRCCLCMAENRKREKKSKIEISEKIMRHLNDAEKVARYKGHENKKKKYEERTRILTVVMSICLIGSALNIVNIYSICRPIPEEEAPIELNAEYRMCEEVEIMRKTMQEVMVQTTLQLSLQSQETISYGDVEKISFCLNEVGNLSLKEQDAKRIFYSQYPNEENELNDVKTHVEGLNTGVRTSGRWKLTETENGVISLASSNEIDFKERVGKAKSYKEKRQMKEWQNTVPDASDYQKDVIDMRISIIESEKADGEICFLVANDYQYLGDEYKNQDKEYEAVIYYWGQSIIYTEEALMYKDISEESRNDYYVYLKGRYKDIADYIEQVWDWIEEGDKEMYGEWRDAARKIYEEMP